MLMPAQTNFLSRLAFIAFACVLIKPDQAPDSDIAEAVRQRRGLPLRHPDRAAERQKQREMEEQQWQQPQQQQLGNNGAPARNMREAQLRQQQQWAQQHVQEQQQLQQQREADAQLGGGGESYDELRKRNRMTPGYQVAPAPSPPQQVWIRNYDSLLIFNRNVVFNTNNKTSTISGGIECFPAAEHSTSSSCCVPPTLSLKTRRIDKQIWGRRL